MKGCLKFFFLIFFIGVLLSIFVHKESPPASVSITPKPNAVASATASPRPVSSPAAVQIPAPTPTPVQTATPEPFPSESYWPDKAHLVREAVMTGANGGITMKLPSGTEVWVFLSEDQKTVKVQTKDPDLTGTVLVEDTDFIQLARQKQKQRLEEKKARAARAQQELAVAANVAAVEEAAYGPKPDFYDAGFSKHVPDNILAGLKRLAIDPDSIKIREIGSCQKEQHGGEKCWHIQFSYQGRNGFGGPSTGIVDAWIRNGQVLDIAIKE
jgi:hypothetical protein